MSTIVSASQVPARTYHLAVRWYLFAAGIAAFGIGGAWLMLRLLFAESSVDTASAIVAVIGAMIIFDVGVALAFGVAQMRLVVTAEGIVYHALGYHVRSSWANVERYGRAWAGRSTLDGLVLRDPRLEVSPWLQSLIGMQPGLTLIGLLGGRYVRQVNMEGYGQVIPIGMFAPEWQQQALGNDIRRFAPWVLDTEITPASATSTPAPSEVMPPPGLYWRYRTVLAIVGLAEVALAVMLIIYHR